MDDRLFELLDDLNIRDTKVLLDKEINLSVDYFTRKRIEKSVNRKTGYYNKNNTIIKKINNILGEVFMRKKIILAIAACFILSSGAGVYAYAKTPVAYVSMDINPSVELGVNAFDKVVSVEAYNDDGKKILEDIDLKNYDINNAISTLVSNAISEGYIYEDGSSVIEITTSTDKDKIAIKFEESLKEVTDKTLDDSNIEADVETENVALARRDEARKLGITSGKLNLIQKLQELDPTINIDDYKDSSVKEIQKKTIELGKGNKSGETSTNTNSDITSDEVTEENNSSTNNKHNISSNNDEKEENNTGNKEENTTTNTTEIQNKNNNANSQGNNNANSQGSNNSSNSANNSNSKPENNSNSNVEINSNQRSENTSNSNSEHNSNSKSENNSSNSNYSKSENSGNGNSNSQNKDQNKRN